MSTGRHAFKHNDAARLIRVAKEAKLAVKGMTLDQDGVLTVLTEDGDAAKRDEGNDWDGVLKDAPNQKRAS